MRAKILTNLFLLMAGLVGIWAFFTYVPLLPKKVDLSISVEKEEKLGKRILNNLILNDPKYRPIHNATVDSAIKMIMARLEYNLPDKKFNYRIYVVDNPEVNAFALPGGNIIILKGLIEFCDKPEEVASVIAHEMGHSENRHLISRLIKELGLSIILSGDASILGELGRTASSTVFDRRQEREADLFAMQLLEKSQISPRIIATFFRRLNDEQGSFNQNLEILMTHPHYNKRIRAALEYPLPSNFIEEKFKIDWNWVKKSVEK